MALRMEDIDHERCRPEYESGILEDLAWLGLIESGDFYRQTDNRDAHQAAVDVLLEMKLLYPCFCTRREIMEEAARGVSAPHGSDGPLYPGTCRELDPAEVQDRLNAGAPHTLRLNMEKAEAVTGPLTWHDRAAGMQKAEPARFGDVVLARRFDQFSYHLCCVVDDATQQIELVTRGHDLFDSTHVHRVLQSLLGLQTPEYHHHGLVVDARGMRLAKRSDSLSVRSLRENHWSPTKVLAEAVRMLETKPVRS